jgi:hypothetical protein
MKTIPGRKAFLSKNTSSQNIPQDIKKEGSSGMRIFFV